MREFDAIVIGVGGMGSAAVYHLARRGWSVLGLEQYDVPNELGSSHGISRMIRLAYHEDPSYVPLLLRAYELWHQLENVAGERLLINTGCLRGGVGANRLLEGSLETVRLHNLPHRLLSGPQVNQEWPGYNLPEEAELLYEPNGGFLLSERCIISHVAAALDLGAEVHGREAALDWEPTASGGVIVHTDKRHLHRPQSDYHRRRLGRQSCAGNRRTRPARTPGAGLVRATPPGIVPAGYLPGLRSGSS